MKLFEWSDSLELGIDQIDNQHKKLVDMINTINEIICTPSKGTVELDSLFENLFDYTNYHFQTEEQLFEDMKYEHSNEHKLAHDKLRNELSEFYSKYAKYEQDEREILGFLTNWLKDHILIKDKKYAKSFLNSNKKSN